MPCESDGRRPSGAESRSLLAVVVNYRLAGRIEELLASGVLCGHDVLLVDNASEPGELRQIADRHRTDLMLLDRNYGFAGAVNRAVAHAQPHAQILLVNPDVTLTASMLSSLQRALAQGSLTAVSPLLLNSDGSVQVGTAGGPATGSAVAIYFLFVSHVIRRAKGIFYTRRQLSSGLEPAWLCMACLLLQGDAFTRYGPIPEYEIVYAEDVAWGIRASRTGARFAVLADVRAIHEQGAAGESDRWRGALGRLVIRENGSLRGWLAVSAMWLGLGVRGVVRRPARSLRSVRQR